jgi:hypothetical protein
MYLLLSRSKYTEGDISFYDGYYSTMTEDGESLVCKEERIDWWEKTLDSYKSNPKFTVEEINEDKFIIREHD